MLETEKRPRSPGGRRWLVAFPWLAVVLALGVVVATYQDYGPTWDEAIQARYGELALAYFASGGSDTRSNEYLDLRYYGPLVEMLPALADGTVRGAARYEQRHLYLGLLAVALLPAAWAYGRRLGGATAALLALPAVALQPRLLGHWFNNSKDLPFAVLVAWFFVSLSILVSSRHVSWRWAAFSGASLGLALCVRPGGLPLLLTYLGAALLIRIVSQRLVEQRLVERRRDSQQPDEREATVPAGAAWVGRLLLLLVIAWVVMVLPWPWAHQSPILHPLEAMRMATDFPTTMPVLFAGETVRSDALPRTYPAHYTAIATPLPLLGLAILAPLSIALARRKLPRHGPALAALAATWILVPLLAYAVLRPNVYGGMRHFLFVLPAVGLLAAGGAAAIVLRTERPAARRLAGALLVAVLLWPLVPMVRLHPYQATYYNALVGGVHGASGRYWTDYALSSYAEAIRWVNGRHRLSGGPTRVILSGGPPILLWAREYAADGVEVELLRQYEGRGRRLPRGHWYVGTTRLQSHQAFPRDPVVHTIGRRGAVFTVIKGAANDPSRADSRRRTPR